MVVIEQMHKDFIIVPVDKATFNYALKFYTDRIKDELNNNKDCCNKVSLGANAIINKFKVYHKNVKEYMYIILIL